MHIHMHGLKNRLQWLPKHTRRICEISDMDSYIPTFIHAHTACMKNRSELAVSECSRRRWDFQIWLHTYPHAYTHTCIYMHILYMHACTCMHTHIHAYRHFDPNFSECRRRWDFQVEHTHTYPHACMQTCMHTLEMHTHMHACKYACVHICMRHCPTQSPKHRIGYIFKYDYTHIRMIMKKKQQHICMHGIACMHTIHSQESTCIWRSRRNIHHITYKHTATCKIIANLTAR